MPASVQHAILIHHPLMNTDIGAQYPQALTRDAAQEIIGGPGIRNTRVGLLTPEYREEHYERLQPQGGRCIGSCQQDRC